MVNTIFTFNRPATDIFYNLTSKLMATIHSILNAAIFVFSAMQLEYRIGIFQAGYVSCGPMNSTKVVLQINGNISHQTTYLPLFLMCHALQS